MTDARARAEAQLQEHRALLHLSGPSLIQEKLLQYEPTAQRLQEMVDFYDGFRSEHLTLVDRVASLLGVVSTMHAGMPLSESLPPGTAPAFKRQLVELAKYVKGH